MQTYCVRLDVEEGRRNSAGHKKGRRMVEGHNANDGD
jgi:hypothetical protein